MLMEYRILIVEDEPGIAQAIRGAMHGSGPIAETLTNKPRVSEEYYSLMPYLY